MRKFKIVLTILAIAALLSACDNSDSSPIHILQGALYIAYKQTLSSEALAICGIIILFYKMYSVCRGDIKSLYGYGNNLSLIWCAIIISS